MASSKEYLDFILDQIHSPDVTARAMMGEYVLYYQGKVFGGIYDDRLLLKPVNAACTLLPNAPRELPYPGAKEMLLVEDVENGALLRQLLATMEPELPAPKRRK